MGHPSFGGWRTGGSAGSASCLLGPAISRIIGALRFGSQRSGTASAVVSGARKAAREKAEHYATTQRFMQLQKLQSKVSRALRPMTPNPSIERTANGLRPSSAAHVKR